ncbi:type I pullulanase [Salipaludibacillus sp. CUR1]|uniref:type I pullulanase n=1 Tax=Salipaludibacillus sp. CUR1 TaxID=2820003 RepID=UPI001E4CA346|nr:type I pullulanase [Salipaludibacillus sp. CUR1]MCE7791438.1 type I pullulanase [Salipaludibacillus sp. CUR1]
MDRMTAWIEDRKCVELKGEGAGRSIHSGDAAVIKGKNILIPLYAHHVDVNRVILHSTEDLPLGTEMELECKEVIAPVYAGKVVRTKWFDDLFNASEEILGATYQPEYSTFRVWSPVAVEMSLNLNGISYSMNKKGNGVWEHTVAGNCEGVLYSFSAKVNGKVIEASDPYAKALTANSTSAVVADLGKTDPEHFRTYPKPELEHLQDSSIYEIHIRDATIHKESGAAAKGKYTGLAEPGTKTGNGYTTGLDYISELGVTHVQLLPVNDFARVDDYKPESGYNWGYDPLFYQVPEGSYCTAPANPYNRITELKELIKSFNLKGLSVIIDVVYNHVFIMEESPLEKLVPGYYFRYHLDGSLSNGTGVGNDLATERNMVKKLILDTVDFWLSEYRIDGFRFDLMGAMDIDTMKEISRRCKEENRPIMLLGEGWELPTALERTRKATNFQSGLIPDVRFFNDLFRDSLKGSLFDFDDYGYINGKGRFIERLSHLVKGSCMSGEGHPPFVQDVTQTVNYVECHDNHTLWDRLLITNSHENELDRMEMHKLATGLTVLSQGIPFLHAGQEWFRSKNGDGNSYISGDLVNHLDWMERELNNEHIQYVRDLLTIRNKYPVFRIRSAPEITRRLHVLATPAPVFGYTLLGKEYDFCVFVNPTKKRYQLKLPSPGSWEILLSSKGKDFRSHTIIKGEFTEVEPYELIVTKKSRL